MDNLTHSLVGALIGQAGLKRRTGLAMPALIIGANLPDVDFVTYFLDGNQHLALRRGITHGPIAWVVLPVLLAGALWWFDRWQARRGTRPEGRLPVRFGWLYALGFIACLTHPALDWLNVYGVRLLEPFSSRWFYGDTLFIIDVWLWLGMGFATWLSLRREMRGGEWRRPARIAIVAALTYIGLNGAITARAERNGKAFVPVADVIASPPPLAFWQREIIFHAQGAEAELANPVLGHWSLVDGVSTEAGSPSRKVAYIEDGEQPSPSASQIARENSQVAAFLFWSRTPLVECGADGSVLIRDARYYDPRARDRFSVALPEVRCEPL